MYNGYFQQDSPTVRPNYSIDLAISRVHIVAGNINELSHVANYHAKQVVGKGEGTLNNFNTHFSNITSNFAQMAGIARERTSDIPLNVLFAASICALVLIVLAFIYLALFGVHRVVRKKYETVRPQRIV